MLKPIDVAEIFDKDLYLTPEQNLTDRKDEIIHNFMMWGEQERSLERRFDLEEKFAITEQWYKVKISAQERKRHWSFRSTLDSDRVHNTIRELKEMLSQLYRQYGFEEALTFLHRCIGSTHNKVKQFIRRRQSVSCKTFLKRYEQISWSVPSTKLVSGHTIKSYYEWKILLSLYRVCLTAVEDFPTMMDDKLNGKVVFFHEQMPNPHESSIIKNTEEMQLAKYHKEEIIDKLDEYNLYANTLLQQNYDIVKLMSMDYINQPIEKRIDDLMQIPSLQQDREVITAQKMIAAMPESLIEIVTDIAEIQVKHIPYLEFAMEQDGSRKPRLNRANTLNVHSSRRIRIPIDITTHDPNRIISVRDIVNKVLYLWFLEAKYEDDILGIGYDRYDNPRFSSLFYDFNGLRKLVIRFKN